ncbi:PilZ domain-containing protein [Stakelama saccharophila]|uniref:PilZ domain-containing protein n=1 Tax=Stakelama saccharophila TaxID=3075605 RepID=A0ABZ0B862_9SPHN|nr:PilZ domain-containing protein [Stakelama sp. W311]WNO52524.1 PilZ domain-containing protein [Stakelama sp. W311]
MIDVAKPEPFAAEFEPVESLDMLGWRRSHRAEVSLEAKLGHGAINRALCKVVDLSLHGCRVQSYSELRKGALIWLTMPRFGPRIARVAWIRGLEAGCDFEEPLSIDVFHALIEASYATH